MRIAFDGTTLRPRPHRRRLLHRAPAAPPRPKAPDDEFVVMSNRADPTTVAAAAERRAYHDRHRAPIRSLAATLAPGVLAIGRQDVAHFTNGMMPLASHVLVKS